MFTYIKLGAVGALVLIVGFLIWNYQSMKIKLVNETAIRVAAETNLKVAEQTINLLRKMENSHEAIDKADNDDVVNYLRTGLWPYSPNTKRDGVSTPAKTTTPGKSPRG
jgi:hypothetical protein